MSPSRSLAALFAGCLLAALAAAAGAREPVLLDPAPSGQSLRGEVAVAGPGVPDDFPAIRAGAGRWEYPRTELRSQPGEPLWLRIQFRVGLQQEALLLELPTTALRDVTVHGPFDDSGRALLPPRSTGLAHPYASRPLGSERVVVPLDGQLEPGSYTLFLRIEAGLDHTVTPRAWAVDDFQYARQHKRLFDGICYGVLLTLLVYNLSLAAVLRDRSYGFYVFACAAALLSLATFNGHTAHYLWPNTPWLIERSYQLFPALWLGFSGLFARAFLATPQRAPGADKLLIAITALAFLNAGVGAAGFTLPAQRATELMALGGSLFMLAVSFRAWRGGYAPAFWYMLALTGLFITIGITVLASWGLSGSPFLLANSLQLGILVEMVGLAMALSARIRLIQSEKLALTLESRVLAEAAATDPLTGAGNRKALREGARQILDQPGQHALLLLDLDHFKATNDSRGHAAGDQVLRITAYRLRQQLRDSDLVTRAGGDEFVVLLGASPEGAALEAMVRRLTEQLSEPVPFEDGTLPVSISIGVALFPSDGEDLDALMRAADRAMYHSKKTEQGFAFVADLPVRNDAA